MSEEEVVPADVECGRLIWDVAFHPTADILAAGCIDGNVLVYKYAVDETTLLYDLPCHKDGVRSMAFTPDGSRLYTVSSDNTLKALECSSKNIVFDKRDTGHTEALNAIKFLNETLYVTGCDDGIVQLWDVRQMSPAMKWTDLLGSGIHSFTANPSKNHIFAGSDDGSLAIFSMRKAEAETLTSRNDDGILSMELINGGSHLACGCSSGVVRLWKYGVWDKTVDNLKGHPSEVEGIICMKDGDVITASCDGCVRAVRLTPQPKLLDTLGCIEDTPSMRLSQSRCKSLVACGGAEQINFFDVRRYMMGTAQEQPHGAAFLKKADDNEINESAPNEDDDEYDSDDESDSEVEETKQHKKGKHRVDFKREGQRQSQKKFFGGL
eukprot:TRINITY_DN975_c1_g1_i1.p1 TRINITY_DN975_c1_g1~~TRINITY_DN975_c1_g1_i1.p1  ORF type:complete len:380 (+),score=83.09 TRINITY_DN975_c1_g1_i1:41-1180(+)